MRNQGREKREKGGVVFPSGSKRGEGRREGGERKESDMGNRWSCFFFLFFFSNFILEAFILLFWWIPEQEKEERKEREKKKEGEETKKEIKGGRNLKRLSCLTESGVVCVIFFSKISTLDGKEERRRKREKGRGRKTLVEGGEKEPGTVVGGAGRQEEKEGEDGKNQERE